MVNFGTVEKKKFKLIATGEYIFTLTEVGETDGDFGTRMVWDYLVAEKDTPTDYITQDDGKARTLRFWTDPEVTIGSQQHEWIQALSGREFGLDSKLPDGEDLLSKRMLAYLTHYTPKRGKNAGVPREDIVRGSAKPFSIPRGKASVTTPAGTTDPVADDGAERTTLIAEIKKQIRRAAILDIDAAAAWGDIDLNELSVEDLRGGLTSIKEQIEVEQAA